MKETRIDIVIFTRATMHHRQQWLSVISYKKKLPPPPDHLTPSNTSKRNVLESKCYHAMLPATSYQLPYIPNPRATACRGALSYQNSPDKFLSPQASILTSRAGTQATGMTRVKTKNNLHDR